VILITGITGYIGSQIGKTFVDNIDELKYKIRASVRDLKNLKKIEALR